MRTRSKGGNGDTSNSLVKGGQTKTTATPPADQVLNHFATLSPELRVGDCSAGSGGEESARMPVTGTAEAVKLPSTACGPGRRGAAAGRLRVAALNLQASAWNSAAR